MTDQLTDLERKLKHLQTERAMGALKTSSVSVDQANRLILEAGICQGLDMALEELEKLRTESLEEDED